LDIDVDDVEEGEIVQCDECGTDLEVVSSDPLELAPVDEEGYDDEDDALPLAQKNAPRNRIAEGKVVNKDGGPVGGAVVYLKNTRSNAIRTFIADEQGQYRFGELSQDTDYEIWAESNTIRSKSRQISSFDNENKFYFVLKVNSGKTPTLDGPST
jgi:lysine biosynthesis protein LysW